MTLDSDNYLGSFQNGLGKFLILVGIGLLFLGIMFLSALASLYEYSWVSAIGFILGMILTGIGLLIQLDFYSAPGIIGKVTSVLVSASFGFFGALIVAITYVQINGYTIITMYRLGEPIYRLVPFLIYPFGFLVYPFLTCGLSLLLSGVILRIVRGVF